MSKFVINSTEEAIEAAIQYQALGLPLPVDLEVYFQNLGLILTDPSIDTDDLEAYFDKDH